jgi:solute carrier family 25 (mitochondrial carnitine/acylcarnitine transporter), member 20/29
MIAFISVKLQMQHQRSVADRQYKGPIDCIRQITRSQGVPGLWNGFTGSLAFRANFLWMFLGFEVMFLNSGKNENHFAKNDSRHSCVGFQRWMVLDFRSVHCRFAEHTQLNSDIFLQMSTGTANFLSGGLASFGFWIMGIPADNIKK